MVEAPSSRLAGDAVALPREQPAQESTNGDPSLPSLARLS